MVARGRVGNWDSNDAIGTFDRQHLAERPKRLQVASTIKRLSRPLFEDQPAVNPEVLFAFLERNPNVPEERVADLKKCFYDDASDWFSAREKFLRWRQTPPLK